MSIRNLVASKRLVVAAAAPAAVLASGAMVMSSSYSAFSATTDDPVSNWSSGTVTISDNSAAATFTASGLKPGATGARCIKVTTGGSLASTVRLYGAEYATTKSLSDHLDLKVEEGTGDAAGCGDFVAAANGTVFDGTVRAFGAKTDFASGVGTWAPAAGTQTRTYRIGYTLSASTPNTAQAGTAKVAFTWEA